MKSQKFWLGFLQKYHQRSPRSSSRVPSRMFHKFFSSKISAGAFPGISTGFFFFRDSYSKPSGISSRAPSRISPETMSVMDFLWELLQRILCLETLAKPSGIPLKVYFGILSDIPDGNSLAVYYRICSVLHVIPHGISPGIPNGTLLWVVTIILFSWCMKACLTII